jgi:hypothetical protein
MHVIIPTETSCYSIKKDQVMFSRLWVQEVPPITMEGEATEKTMLQLLFTNGHEQYIDGLEASEVFFTLFDLGEDENAGASEEGYGENN